MRDRSGTERAKSHLSEQVLVHRRASESCAETGHARDPGTGQDTKYAPAARQCRQARETHVSGRIETVALTWRKAEDYSVGIARESKR